MVKASRPTEGRDQVHDGRALVARAVGHETTVGVLGVVVSSAGCTRSPKAKHTVPPRCCSRCCTPWPWSSETAAPLERHSIHMNRWMVQCGRTVLAGQYHVVVQELVVVQATSTIQAACVTVTYVFIKATEYGALCLTVSYPCTPPVTSTVGLAESHPRVLTANRGYLPTQTNATPCISCPGVSGWSTSHHFRICTAALVASTAANARESRSRLRPTHAPLFVDGQGAVLLHVEGFLEGLQLGQHLVFVRALQPLRLRHPCSTLCCAPTPRPAYQ